MLLNPACPNYIIKYSELLYTIGGTENLQKAVKYLSAVIKDHDYDLRACFVLYQTLRALFRRKGHKPS